MSTRCNAYLCFVRKHSSGFFRSCVLDGGITGPFLSMDHSINTSLIPFASWRPLMVLSASGGFLWSPRFCHSRKRFWNSWNAQKSKMSLQIFSNKKNLKVKLVGWLDLGFTIRTIILKSPNSLLESNHNWPIDISTCSVSSVTIIFFLFASNYLLKENPKNLSSPPIGYGLLMLSVSFRITLHITAFFKYRRNLAGIGDQKGWFSKTTMTPNLTERR